MVQNWSKIGPKSVQNRFKTVAKLLLGARGAPGRCWAPKMEPPAPNYYSPALKNYPPWEVLLGLLAPLGAHFSRSFFRRLFDRFLVGFSLPKPSPNRAKIDQKTMSKCTSILTSFFCRFLTKFRFQRGPPNLKNIEKSFVFIVFRGNTPF